MIVFRRSYPQPGMPIYQGTTDFYEGQIVQLSDAEEKQFVDTYFAEYYKNENDYYQPYDVMSDRSGTVIGFAGPDGIKSAIKDKRFSPIRVATFGDSTANSVGISGGVDTAFVDVIAQLFPVASGGAVVVNFDDAEVSLGRHSKRFIVFNGGISGDGTATMLARGILAPSITRKSIADLLSSSPDLVVVRAGINDIQGLTAASTDAQIESTVQTGFARHIDIVSKIVAGGCHVIVEALLGYSLPSAIANWGPIRKAMLRYNELMKAYYFKMPNVSYIDLAGVTYDPATGAFLDGMSGDGLHISSLAGVYISALEKAVEESVFGTSGEMRYVGKNYLRNATFNEEGTVAQPYGTTPGGYSAGTNAATTTRQNAKIEVINGRQWFTCEFVPNNTVTSINPANGSIVIPLALSSLMTLAGANQDSIFGFEVDFFIKSLDGTPIKAKFSGNRIQLFKTVAGTQNGRLVFDLTQGVAYPAGSPPTFPSYFEAKLVSPPIKIGEPAANIDDTRSSTVSVGVDVFDQKTFKVGISSPRLVFLDQTFFNA